MRHSNKKNVFIGLDPGIRSIGYGVIETVENRISILSCGLLVPEKRRRHYRDVVRALRRLLDRWKPNAVGIEKIIFGRNARTAIAIAEMIGVLKLAIEESKIPSREFSPPEIKRAITGKGAAPKQAVGNMVGAILGLRTPPSPHHAADALAVALTLERYARMEQNMRG